MKEPNQIFAVFDFEHQQRPKRSRNLDNTVVTEAKNYIPHHTK